MNIRALFAGVGAAAVVASGTLALTSTVASAQSKPQTLTYYTATLKSVAYSSTRSAVTESVDNSSGKLVGFEVETVSRAINAPITTFGDVIYLTPPFVIEPNDLSKLTRAILEEVHGK